MSKVLLPFIRSPYNYDRNVASEESGLFCDEPSRTNQSFKEEVDINTIVRRFGLSGELPSGVIAPTYGDFTGVFDFHSAMTAVAQANEAFDSMPAHVRARFNNDPGLFVDFCSDEKNRDEAVRLGLVVPSPEALAAGVNDAVEVAGKPVNAAPEPVLKAVEPAK